MDTRTPDDVMDERLGAAGDRLRATAPSPAATQVALTGLRRRSGRLYPLRWVLPVGLVAAAATALGVLVLTRGADEAEPEVPAVTPPVTAAPTTPATTTTTAVPARPPAFVGDPPLSASAAVFGCPGTLGEIAAGLDPSLYPVSALGCSALDAQAVSGDTVVGLSRQQEGTWSEVTRESSTCLPSHCSFQFDMLQIPPATLVVRDLGDLRPEDVTPEVRAEAAEVQVSEPQRFVRSLGARPAVG